MEARCKRGRRPLEHAAASCPNASVIACLLACHSESGTAVDVAHLLELVNEENDSLEVMLEVLKHDPSHPMIVAPEFQAKLMRRVAMSSFNQTTVAQVNLIVEQQKRSSSQAARGPTRQVTTDDNSVDLQKVGGEETEGSRVEATVYEVDNSEAAAAKTLKEEAAAAKTLKEEATAAAELSRKQAEEEEHKARLQRDLEELQKQKETNETKRVADEAEESRKAMAENKKMAEDAALAKEMADGKNITPAAPVGMSFVKMKMYLEKNGVDRNRVDNCLGKYELEKLAAEVGVAFPVE